MRLMRILLGMLMTSMQIEGGKTMEMFDKRFVHFMWDESLRGKEGFFADNIIDDLIDYVEKNVSNKGELVEDNTDNCSNFPFRSVNDEVWRFFYYDPLYEYKWAHKQGKKVQYKMPLSGWTDMEEGDTWDYSLKHRIVEDEEAAEQRVTSAQLSEWLAKGNGVYRTAPDGTSRTVHEFNEENADDPADLCVEVRRWEDKEWHNPVVAYCFPETASPAQDET